MNTYLIHLSSMPEREPAMARTMARLPGITVVEGIRDPDPKVGCNLSHKLVVRLAQVRGLPYVGILEDDCEFSLAWSEAVWNALGNWMALGGFSILNGGVSWFSETQNLPLPMGSAGLGLVDLVELDRFYGSHCLIVKADAYDAILATQPDEHIDHLYATLPGLRKVATVPFLATQSEGWSVVKGRRASPASAWKNVELKLMEAIR